MSWHSRFPSDMIDYHIQRSLQGWASSKEPPAEARTRLLRGAASLALAPARLRQYLHRSPRRMSRSEVVNWALETGRHGALIWFSGDLGLLRLRI